MKRGVFGDDADLLAVALSALREAEAVAVAEVGKRGSAARGAARAARRYRWRRISRAVGGRLRPEDIATCIDREELARERALILADVRPHPGPRAGVRARDSGGIDTP